MTYFYTNGCQYNSNLDILTFNKLIEENKKKYFYKDGISEYIEKWKSALSQIYFSELKSQFNLIHDDFFSYEIFNNNGINLSLHFNINKAEEFLKYTPIQKVPLTKFATKDNITEQSNILFSTPDFFDSKHDYINDVSPIIIINLILNNMKYLVIDGNHRVAKKIASKKMYVNASLLEVDYTIDLFYSKFEMAVYCFLIEGELINKYDDFSFSKVNYFLNLI